ncbi:MAG: hypothetical protein ACOZQL_10925 [Myxococcota bacterium]
MARFSDALASNPAPAALGDVVLRYEPSMLLGETPKQPRSWLPTLAWLLGISLLLGAVGVLVLSASDALLVVFLVLGAAAIAAATRLERFEKRQRRFIANFATVSLRLDFASAIAGYPKTLVVPFDAVKDVSLVPQADGARCLLVDFQLGDRLLREVLVAYISEGQLADAERLERVLHGAFGLGAPPVSEPPGFSEESTFG